MNNISPFESFKSFAALAVSAAAFLSPAPASATQDTLYVWAGDVAHQAPDFFAVVDFDKGSSKYGKVVNIAPLPDWLPTGIPLSTGAIGNEPHHVGLSADGKTLAGGGLLSVLRLQNQSFFWDITNARTPVFRKANTLPIFAATADEFAPRAGGGFFTTFMGGIAAAAPGRLVEYDANANVVGLWPIAPPLDGFNPHGLAIDEAHNLLLTSDFICPLHSLNLIPGVIDGMVVARATVRVWNIANRTITKTITVGNPANPAGTLNVELIPNDPRLRAYVVGVLDGKLYLVDPTLGTATPAIDFNSFALPGAREPWPNLFRINKAGTRLVITLNYKGLNGKVVYLDIENRAHPSVLSVVDLGPSSGPHYVTFSPNEDRVVISDYFLVQDLFPTGVLRVDGDHKIHTLNVVGNTLVKDASFDLDFNRDIATGPARPHGLVIVSR